MLKLLLWLCLVGFGVGLIVEFLKLLIDIFLATWPVLLMFAGGALACWLAIKFFRNRKKKAPKEISVPVPQYPTSCIGIMSDPVIKDEEQPDYFNGSYELIRSFYTKVVGTSHPNDDGTSRQEILSRCNDGEQITLDWRTFNGDSACAVISDHGQIGFLKADLADDLYRDYVDGYEQSDVFFLFAQIANITGGEYGLQYGCNIRLSIYGLPSPYRDELLPVAVDVILETGQASVTQLQKHLHIGHSRASKLMDELEENGIVGPFQGSKPRTVLITKQEWDLQRKQ